MTQPSSTLVFDLKIAIERLARTSTVMNLAIKEGIPLRLLDVMVKPVSDSAQDVRRLITQAVTDGVDLDALSVQISEPIRDSLAELLSEVISVQVPDSLEGM